MARAERRAAHRRGLWAESAAALYLRLKGWRILARRARTPAGEIDIVAGRGATIAFVEVKARARLAEAAEALQPRQRRRIAQAAQLWIARRPELSHAALRFDEIWVAPWRPPRHIEDAWSGE